MFAIATYNIRNVRALDLASCWWRRRRSLDTAIARLDVDVLAMQEAYPSQRRYLARNSLRDWTMVGTGRNADGGGEGCPIAVRPGPLRVVSSETRWFGSTPDVPGSRLPGAGFPRIATIAVIEQVAGARFVVANTHLDEKVEANRTRSLEQLSSWLVDDFSGLPAIVCGDLNTLPGAPPLDALAAAGLRPLLRPEHGPTSNGFGDPEHAHQIDHVFVSPQWPDAEVRVHVDAGHASDHWPVSARFPSVPD